MKECTLMNTHEVGTICPHCEHQNEGWCVDPRGCTDKCDRCGKEYKVHPEADIEML